MCGIAGYVTTQPAAPPDSVLERMTGVLTHRGPDGFGYHRDPHAQLGHRRLSIIDLAGGSQPMYNEDGALAIVYNGEIFNHADWRAPLEAAGHRYRSRCDTEFILHAYEEYGPEALDRFRGMFAFAVWDQKHQALFCARDRLGKKPLYYYWDGRLFAFASEIKALLEHPSISPTLDETTLAEYLAFGYLSDERTMFAGVRQLMPGHWLRLTLGGGEPRLEIRQYWDAPKGPDGEPETDDEAVIRECRERLEETVRLRLMSDVPLGMFLSGGVDSSVIAALMKRMVTGPVVTFSVGYRETEFSELAYSRQVAEHLGTKHQEVVVEPQEFFNALPRLVWHEDEPVTWPSSVSLYFVSGLAAREVKVVLTGEGSDELFAGYARYRHYLRSLDWMRYYGAVPRLLRDWLRRRIAATSLLPAGLRRKLQHTVLGRAGGLASLYLDNFYCAFSQRDLEGLLKSKPQPGPVYAAFEGYHAAANQPLAQMLYADQKTYLVELLRKQDRMSMACSIESRVPFLDHPFVEFAARVPARLKIREGVTKYILKRAASDLLPESIIHRRKMGFPTPLSQWLHTAAGASAIDLIQRPDGLVGGYLDMKAVERLVERHRSRKEDATDRIWRLLNLQIWGDVFLTGRREALWEGFVPATPAGAGGA